MWELICHHEYKWGTIAADRSLRRSDGIPTAVEPVPGEPGLRFSRFDSGVRIPRRQGDAWGSMRWLHLEVIARFFGGGGSLIDADQSFVVYQGGIDDVITVEIAGETFPLVKAPLDVWHHFTFERSGLNNFGWSFSEWAKPGGGAGAAGGGGISTVEVPGVGPRGVVIGNSVRDSNNPMHCDIALIKIARFDPRSMSNDFLARPIDVGVANCWAEFFRKLKDAIRKDPKCGYWLAGFVRRFQENLLQGVAQAGPEKIEEFKKMGREYGEFWEAGKVGSPEMQALAVKMRDWLKDEGLLSLDDPGLHEDLTNPCFHNLIALMPSLDCDPEFQSLIRAILGVGEASRNLNSRA